MLMRVCPALFAKVKKRKGRCFSSLIQLTLSDLQKKLCWVGVVFFQKMQDMSNLEGFAFLFTLF